MRNFGKFVAICCVIFFAFGCKGWTIEDELYEGEGWYGDTAEEEVVPETETDEVFVPETELELEFELETETELEPELETETEPETETECETETEPEPEPEPESECGTEPEPEPSCVCTRRRQIRWLSTTLPTCHWVINSSNSASAEIIFHYTDGLGNVLAGFSVQMSDLETAEIRTDMFVRRFEENPGRESWLVSEGRVEAVTSWDGESFNTEGYLPLTDGSAILLQAAFSTNEQWGLIQSILNSLEVPGAEFGWPEE